MKFDDLVRQEIALPELEVPGIAPKEIEAMKKSRRTKNRLPVVIALGLVLVTMGVGLWLLIKLPNSLNKFGRGNFSEPGFVQGISNLVLAETVVYETVEWTEKAQSDIPLLSSFLDFVDSKAHYLVRFKVKYAYAVDMTGEWRSEAAAGSLTVMAPDLIPRTPAIDTSSIKTYVDGGWLVIGEENKLRSTQALLSEIAAQRAEEKISFILEPSRKQLEEFLDTWTSSLGHEFNHVEVRFANEDSLGLAEELSNNAYGFSQTPGK